MQVSIIQVTFDLSARIIMFTIDKEQEILHLTQLLKSNFKVMIPNVDDVAVYGWSLVEFAGTSAVSAFTIVKRTYHQRIGMIRGIKNEYMFYVGGLGTAILSYQVASRMP